MRSKACNKPISIEDSAKSRVRWLASVITTGLLMCFAVAAFISARMESEMSMAEEKTSVSNGVGNQDPPPVQNQLVNRASVWAKLRSTLRVMGDRMEKSGKERLVMIGSLNRFSDSQSGPHPFRLITEIPIRMRLEEQINQRLEVTLFNGQEGMRTGRPATRFDEDIIETLAFDNVEHFFLGQTKGLATRMLGERFRLDEGTVEGYEDGFYDIYEVRDQISIGRSAREQSKLFYFNADTLMLERVRYVIDRDGSSVNVEVLIGGWRKVNGQVLPHSITRIENGQKVLELTIGSINFGPGMNDGAFDRP